jgi:hypothetical protein
MRNADRKECGGGISRRKMMQGLGTGIVAAGSIPELLAKSTASSKGAPSDERDTMFSILAFWVAVTNPALSLPTDYATMADITGLPQDDVLKKAVDWVNKHTDSYKQIVRKFTDLEKILGYGPGECPKHLATLKQIAALKPA